MYCVPDDDLAQKKGQFNFLILFSALGSRGVAATSMMASYKRGKGSEAKHAAEKFHSEKKQK